MRPQPGRTHPASVALLAALVALAAPQPAHTPAACHTPRCERRVTRRHWRHTTRPHRAWLKRTRTCESAGRYRINTGNGFYGAYQFTLSSWQAVGGNGYPHHASRLEQDYRAVRLLELQGHNAWPICG